jgi:ligand-binding SRPBCC domain-containing protein
MEKINTMLQITANSGIYTLLAEQKLKLSLGEAWDFFSSPDNLAKITPKEMGFVITSPQQSKMYPGQIITYKVSILPGIKSNWVTEITQVRDKEYFIDEQRFGPYSMWHHEHSFEEIPDGVLMKDKVSYKLPFGILGRMVHPFIIKPQLMKIFSFRFQVLEEYFNKK